MAKKKTPKTKKVVLEVEAPKPQRPEHQRRRRSRGESRGSGSGAPVSTPGGVVSRNSKPIHVSGTDRFLHVPDISQHAEGTIVFDQAISTLLFPRLAKFGDVYQRVVWRKLLFRVVPSSPTSVSGGYVSSFLADPTDEIGTGSAALARLTANAHTRITKAWQSTVLPVKPVQDDLFTSPTTAGGMRLYSPGRFVLAVDSQVSAGSGQKCPVTVYVDWDVTLHSPSLESDPGSNAGPIATLASLYGRSQNVGLWHHDGAGGDDPRTVILGIKFDVTYRLKNKVFFNVPVEPGNYDRVRLVNHKTHGITLFMVDFAGKVIEEKPATNCWLIEKGDILVPEEVPNQVGLEYLCLPQTKESLSPSTPSLDGFLIKQKPLTSSLDKFEIVSPEESSDRDFVISREQARLMGFL